MQRIVISALLAGLPLLCHAQQPRVSEPTRVQSPDTAPFDALHRTTDPRSPQAFAFLRAYGTPSAQQVAAHGWPVAASLPEGLARHKLGSRGTIEDQPYVLLVDADHKRMYLLRQDRQGAVVYGPIQYPRGI